MITISPVEELPRSFSFSVSPGSLLILRFHITSNFMAPAIIQPKIEEWVNNEGQIISLPTEVNPLYNYLSPRKESTITVTLHIPKSLNPDTEIRTIISFSGYDQCAFDMILRIEAARKGSGPSIEHAIHLTVPPKAPQKINATSENTKETTSETIFTSEYVVKLIAGLTGLEVLPAKWLVSEIILLLCSKGKKSISQGMYNTVIPKLKKTLFFKNASLIVASSQLIQWLKLNASISSGLQAVLGKNEGESLRILKIWEKWLFSLIPKDIEKNIQKDPLLEISSDDNFDAVLEDIGYEPDKFFLYLILGLMQISPRIHEVIVQVSDRIPDSPQEHTDPSHTQNDVLSEKGSLSR